MSGSPCPPPPLLPCAQGWPVFRVGRSPDLAPSCPAGSEDPLCTQPWQGAAAAQRVGAWWHRAWAWLLGPGRVCGGPVLQAGVCRAGRWPAGERPTAVPSLCSPRDPERHVRVKQRGSVLTMLRRLDKIRFRGHKRDDFLDLAESPNASDTECGDDVPLKAPRASPRDSEELRDPVSTAPRGACPPPPASDPASDPGAWCGVPALGRQPECGLGQNVTCRLTSWSSPCPSVTGPALRPTCHRWGVGPWSQAG